MHKRLVEKKTMTKSETSLKAQLKLQASFWWQRFCKLTNITNSLERSHRKQSDEDSYMLLSVKRID